MTRKAALLPMTLGKHKFLVARPTKNCYRQPMVFIHGMAGYARYLDKIMLYFAKLGFTAYAPDIVGHGERINENIARMSVDNYVDDVADFLDTVVCPRHDAPLMLVGHSMGGVIAAKLTERTDVGHTVMITPAPPSGVFFMQGGMLKITYDDIFNLFNMAFGGKRAAPSRDFIASLFADPVASSDIIDVWHGRRIPNESLLVALQIGSSSVMVDRRQIKTPMLVIGAAKDMVIHPLVSRNVAEYFGATHVMLPELGHMCPFEFGWEETAETVKEWLIKKGAL